MRHGLILKAELSQTRDDTAFYANAILRTFHNAPQQIFLRYIHR